MTTQQPSSAELLDRRGNGALHDDGTPSMVRDDTMASRSSSDAIRARLGLPPQDTGADPVGAFTSKPVPPLDFSALSSKKENMDSDDKAQLERHAKYVIMLSSKLQASSATPKSLSIRSRMSKHQERPSSMLRWTTYVNRIMQSARTYTPQKQCVWTK